MPAMETSVLINSIVELFSEAYEGPRDINSTWFIDNEPDAGIFGILKGVSAEEASRSVDGSGHQGSTIAANAEHLRWSIANANGAMHGQPYKSNWSESWELSTADTAAWDRLRSNLRAEFESLRATIQQQEQLSGVYLNGVLALNPPHGIPSRDHSPDDRESQVLTILDKTALLLSKSACGADFRLPG